MMQGLNGLGVGGAKASTGFGQWYTDMQDSKEVRLDRDSSGSQGLALENWARFTPIEQL